MAERDASIAEGDEPGEPASDNSLGRLLASSDGVFAIAMTLLALDPRLPDLGTDASDAQLRHALGDDWRSYLAFVISFYVVAGYWGVHRRAMRGEKTIDAGLAFYSAFNVVANLALLRLLTDVQADHFKRPTSSSGSGYGRTSSSCCCASQAPSY
jgi:uncharacterized membrane protein